MNKETQARPFKVGDPVVSKRFGKGVVLRNDCGPIYPIECKFDRGSYFFTAKGRFMQFDVSKRDIQHAEPEPEKI